MDGFVVFVIIIMIWLGVSWLKSTFDPRKYS